MSQARYASRLNLTAQFPRVGWVGLLTLGRRLRGDQLCGNITLAQAKADKFTLASRPSASPAPTVLLVRGTLFTAKAMSPFARVG